jgi:hypothetical protein
MTAATHPQDSVQPLKTETVILFCGCFFCYELNLRRVVEMYAYAWVTAFPFLELRTYRMAHAEAD